MKKDDFEKIKKFADAMKPAIGELNRRASSLRIKQEENNESK